jgi:hypothetical protein
MRRNRHDVEPAEVLREACNKHGSVRIAARCMVSKFSGCHKGKHEQGIIPLRLPLVSENVPMHYVAPGLTQPSQFPSGPWFVLGRAQEIDLRARFRPVPAPLRHPPPTGNEPSPYQGMPRHLHNSVLTRPTQL